MLAISKKEVDMLLLNKVQQDILSAETEIHFFECKYKCDFISFEQKVKASEKEIFSDWDDYIEWKAEVKQLEYLKKKKEEIEQGHYTITQ